MVFHEDAGWLKNRFQSMGPNEVVSRLTDVGRHVALRASLKRLQMRPYANFVQTNRSYSAPEVRNELNRVSTGTRDEVIEAASRWLEHHASFFALKDAPLGDPIDWHRDYASGIVAPIRYSGLINPRDTSKVGDIKYIWELNRLQHLVLLALARLWTGDAGYWAEIESQIASWKTGNPFMMGVNWKSPLEAAMRIISWAYVAFIAAGWKQDMVPYYDSLAETVYHHQYFIRKFYSKNSSANNHLIGEMAGLYVGSVFWPWYKESHAWRTFAQQMLVQEISRQVESDGVGKEQAIEYQLFILELFLVAGALGEAIGDPFPQEYWDRLNRMSAFLSAISNRAGDLPMFGDGDSGQVIALPETMQQRSRNLARIGQYDESAATRDLRSILVLWGQSPNKIPAIGRAQAPEQGIQSFPDGGYYVLAANRAGEDEIIVVFDAGPLGLPPLNAHGHADALSFWFSYGGQEFLIDPGTYCYHGSARWRSYFRGTAAHNTVRVDGKDQSVAGGSFLWREAADCRLEHVDETDERVGVTGSHKGYRRFPDPVVHTRALRLFRNSRTLVINDHLRCQKAHNIELFFHFSEKCQVHQTGPGAFGASNGKKRVVIRLDPRLQPELYRGSETPIFGWVSRSFGVKVPSFTLVARAEVIGSTDFVTEILAA